MRAFFKVGSSLLIFTIVTLLSGCQTMAPENGGTMSDIQKSLETSPTDRSRAVEAKRVPPRSVSAALLPPVDLRLPKSRGQKMEPRFDVNVTDVPARAFFMGLVEGTPYNMVVHPQVEGVISLSLKNVTIPDVMETLRSVYGYEFQRSRSGFHVLPVRLQSRIFQVNYLNIKRSGSSQTRVSSGQVSSSARSGDDSGNGNGDNSGDATSGSLISTSSESDFWTELSVALRAVVGEGKGQSVVISPQSGIVVVRAMPAELREVENFLQSTDEAMHRQVILEAKILEVELNDGYQAGIDWAKVMTSGNNTLSIGQAYKGDMFSNPGSAGVTLPSGGITDPAVSPVTFTDFSAFGGLFGASLSTGNFLAFIELLESQGNVQVLSSPRIATLNNQKAVIKVGTDEFFVTDVSSTTTTGTATTTTPDITLTPFFSGIALDVTPQIDRQGRVTLHIHPSVSRVTDQQKIIEVGSQTQSLPLAKSTVRESDSIVYANSGQLVVIGGLMENSSGEEVASTPVLGDLPLIGPLFRHTRQGAKKSELVILLRPTVVKNPKTWDEQLTGSAARFRQLNRGFHYGSKPDVFGNLGEKRN